MIETHFDAERLWQLVGDCCVHTRPRGVLVLGAAGTGKTFVLRALAARAGEGAKVLSISCADLINKEVGASEELLKNLFREATSHDRSVLLLDDLDLLLPADRGDGNHRLLASLLGTFLSLLDELEDTYHQRALAAPRCRGKCRCDGCGLLLLASASDRSRLDSALLCAGRLEEEITLPLPTDAARAQFIKQQVAQLPGSMASAVDGDTPLLLEQLCVRSAGWAFAEIKATLGGALLDCRELPAALGPPSTETILRRAVDLAAEVARCK